jgi:hypothetical protein
VSCNSNGASPSSNSKSRRSSGSGGGGEEGGEGFTLSPSLQPLLLDTFSSLSLADKCALTLAQAQGVQAGVGGGGAAASVGGAGVALNLDEVMSASDAQSLQQAIAMMGPQELSRLGEEVRELPACLPHSSALTIFLFLSFQPFSFILFYSILSLQARLIQVNFRSWLLRKHYTSLRDAAKVVQQAWRDRKYGPAPAPAPAPASSAPGEGAGAGADRGGGVATHSSAAASAKATPLRPEALLQEAGLRGVQEQREAVAAATLQTAARRLLARRQILTQVHRQAALVIQRRFKERFAALRARGGNDAPDSDSMMDHEDRADQ